VFFFFFCELNSSHLNCMDEITFSEIQEKDNMH